MANYRVIKNVYTKEKIFYTITDIDSHPTGHDLDFYVEAKSTRELQAMLKIMLIACDRPIMIEEKAFVEIIEAE